MKVSVIIPTYNRARLVSETIDSVLAQTFDDFEIIVVDDGSTDDTEQVLKSYGDKIRYIRQVNGGVNNARNHAVSIAKGEYIATLDNDDLWKPYKLQLEVAILDKYPQLAYLFTNFSIYKNSNDIRENGIQTWFDSEMDWNQFFNDSVDLKYTNIASILPDTKNALLYIGDIYYPSLAHYYVLPSTALFRKSMIPEGVQFIEHDPICGDWDFFARMSRDNPVGYLDIDTTYNRSHEDEVRLTRTKWKTQLEFQVDIVERLYLKDSAFASRHKEDLNRVYRNRLESLARCYLLDGDRKSLDELLNKYRSFFSPYDSRYLIYYLTSKIPGNRIFLKLLRTLRG